MGDKVFLNQKITNKTIYDEILNLKKDLSCIKNAGVVNSARIKLLGLGFGFIGLVVCVVGFVK